MIDGDVVLFNRQPSLHKLSIMCHFVSIFRGPFPYVCLYYELWINVNYLSVLNYSS